MPPKWRMKLMACQAFIEGRAALDSCSCFVLVGHIRAAATTGEFMAQPARYTPNLLEAAVEQAIAVCDGDVRAALRASLIASSFLADEVERLTKEISLGFARGRISPARRASERLNRWRGISAGREDDT